MIVRNGATASDHDIVAMATTVTETNTRLDRMSKRLKRVDRAIAAQCEEPNR